MVGVLGERVKRIREKRTQMRNNVKQRIREKHKCGIVTGYISFQYHCKYDRFDLY
jgi:hypothetical protein